MSENDGYFDLQVNGYGGIDFNKDELTADELHHACQRLENDGVGGILATIITDQLPVMSRRLSAIANLRQRDPLAGRMIAGIHIEGPFLNESKGFPGAHPLDAIRPADADSMKMLLAASGELTRLVTLAPERDPQLRVTKMLASQGITVAAGHTDATVDELRAALDVGLTLFTHLGNGCPMHMHRHDNITQRALSLSDRLHYTLIADGVHIPFFAMKNYLKCAGIERCMIVTDAMAAAGLGPGRYTIGRWDLLVGDDMVARAPDGSHFLGAAITMKQSHQHLREKLGLSEQQCRMMLMDNPRRLIDENARRR